MKTIACLYGSYVEVFFFWVLLQETRKFRTELWNKLLKDEETFGDDLDNVVEVCSEVLFSCPRSHTADKYC